MFKNKFRPTHELRRKISLITVCALLVAVLCGSALLGGCKKTPALSDDVNSPVSGVSGDKNGVTDDNNSAANENSGDTANTGSQATETASGSKEPGNVTGDSGTNNNNTVSTPESESKAPESAATDDKTSNPQQQFKYYIQKLDEYGKTVRQTDYSETKSKNSIVDIDTSGRGVATNTLVVTIMHQYSHPVNDENYTNNALWSINDFKAMGATSVNCSLVWSGDQTNETVYLIFDNSSPEQVLEFGKELENYSCVKAVKYNQKGIPGA